jgi:hypothetical protein
VYVGSNANFKVTVAPAAANLPLYGGPVGYQWVKGTKLAFTVLNDGVSGSGSTLSGTHSASFGIANVQLGDTGSYCCIVTNATATNVFSAVSRLVAKDYTTAPTLVITKAIQNAKFFDTNPVTMYGSATDKGLITDVWLTQKTFGGTTITNDGMTFIYRSNSLHQPIPGSVIWTNIVSLVPGTNVFVANAQNGKGTNGASPLRTIYFLERSSLSLLVTPVGHGTIVSSNLLTLGNPVSGTNVFVNIGYMLTAKPATGKHFLGWLDGSDNPYPSSPANTNKILRFTIPDTNGLTLKATFD